MPYEVRETGEPSKRWCVYKTTGGESLGCHGTKAKAMKQVEALYANEALASLHDGPLVASIGEPVGRWKGVLTTEGVETGDGRTFEANSLVWEPDSPAGMPLRWAPEDMGAHGGARHVGWIENVWRDGADVWGSGSHFDPGFDEYLTAAGKVGLSVDVDSEEYSVTVPEDALGEGETPEPGKAYPALEQKQVFSAGRIRGVTAVDIPAFISGFIIKDNGTAEAPAIAAALLFAGLDDSPENVARVAAYFTEADLIEAAGGTPTEVEDPAALTHSGVLLTAADTGRWLLLQRAFDPTEADDNAGLWEFPGGGIEEGESPLEGASREFAEEVGVPLPEDARLLGGLDSGIYRLHVMETAAESGVDIDGRDVINPDDPHGDITEALAWWAPDHVTCGGYHIRPEVANTDWAAVEAVLESKENAMTDFAPGDTAPPAPGAPAPADAPPTDGAPLTDADKTFLSSMSDLYKQALDGATTFLSANPVGDVAEFAAEVIEKATDAGSDIDEILNPDPLAPTGMDSIIASAAPDAPPDEWFEPRPGVEDQGPLTITADGRVSGYLATWASCHRSEKFSRRGECVQPPSDPDAPMFHLGQVVTASGKHIDVGRLTVGGGHADVNKNITAALEHYDDASAIVAAVRVVEDSIGIGLYGSVTPGATPAQVAAARLAPLSGDWRKERGKYRLIAAHAVVVPGYPVARGLVASVGDNSFVTVSERECSECGGERESLGLIASAVLRETVRENFSAVKEQMRADALAEYRALVASGEYAPNPFPAPADGPKAPEKAPAGAPVTKDDVDALLDGATPEELAKILDAVKGITSPDNSQPAA